MFANVLRAGTLNDERIVRKVSANFVPTHFNNNDPTRDKDSPSAVLWKSITGKKPLQGQGIWIVAPNGDVLGGMSAEVDGHPSDKVGTGPGAPWRSNPKFTEAALELIDQTLQKFGPVTPRTAKAQALPYRGAGIKPDGSVRLVVYNRADNGLVFSVPLTKEQWASFVPPKTEVGAKWNLPESVARQFAPVLSPYADTRFRPRPSEATVAELRGELESFDERHTRIRLYGKWDVDWVHDGNEHSKGSATAEGFAIYNRQENVMRALIMIFDGKYSYTTGEGKPRVQNSSAVVRWRLEGDPE